MSIKVQSITAVLVARYSKGVVDKEHNKAVKRKLKKILTNSTLHLSFDTCFSATDLNTAISDNKIRKAPRRDGDHLEYLYNLYFIF